MRVSRLLVTGLLLTAMTMAGCSNRLKDENAMLTEEVGVLRNQLVDRNAALESCNQELRSRDQQLAQLRREMQEQQAAAPRTGFEGIEGVSGVVGAGEITALVDSDLLFDSGRSTLKASAKRSLDAVASVLNSSYAGKRIRIAGHTDTDPIRKSGYKSNYHLGFERAYAVREYLASKGVSPNRMHIASYGPDVPKGNKAQSRRVEIVVLVN